MFKEKTNQGWEIISKFTNQKGTFIVVKRSNDYAWGSYYNEESGNWAQGHYDYMSPKQAEEDMLLSIMGKDKVLSVEEAFIGLGERLAKLDLEYDLTEADYDEYLSELHKEFEFEIDAGWEAYKNKLELVRSKQD